MDTRPLPPGWVSQWDPSAGRYFFVDTTKNPPESTWDDPRDAPPPYSASMPTPETYQSYSTPSTYPQYPQDPQYPPSDSKAPNAYPGYPSGQPQPDSYNPYNKYDSTATSSTAPKKNGLLSKFGLSSGKHGKASKPDKPNKPNKPKYNNYTPPAASYVPPALGTTAALGALSHHKPGKKKHGLGFGSGVGLGLGGAAAGLLVGNALFGGGFGGCDSDWGGCGDWGGCDW